MVKFVSSLNSNSSFAQFLDSNGLLQQTQTITNVQSNPGGVSAGRPPLTHSLLATPLLTPTCVCCGGPSQETTLDVQWISSMAPGAWTTVWHGGYLQLVGQDGLVQQADPMVNTHSAAAAAAPHAACSSHG